jgi:transposase-like protein
MDQAQENELYEVDCPHCHKPFSAEVILGETARHTGFKCPHCNLFVAYDRTASEDPA